MRTCQLDWYAYSVEWQRVGIRDGEKVKPTQARAALPANSEFDLTGEILHPRPGYNIGYDAGIGRVDYHEDRPEQKIGVQLTGVDLAELEQGGWSYTTVLKRCEQLEGRVTRLDLAVDFTREYVPPAWFLDAWNAGRIKTPARTIHEYTSQTDGEKATTVYIGAPSSDRQLRIYDKGKQMKTSYPWTRAELVLKGERANLAHKAILEHGLAKVVKAAFLDYVVVMGIPAWSEFIDDDDLPVMHTVGRKQTDTKRWLIDVVMPVLEREVQADLEKHDTELYDLLRDILANSRK